MPSDSAMTGTFQTKLPSDLLSAIERHEVCAAAPDLTINSMKPSIMERVLSLFSRSQAPDAKAPRKH